MLYCEGYVAESRHTDDQSAISSNNQERSHQNIDAECSPPVWVHADSGSSPSPPFSEMSTASKDVDQKQVLRWSSGDDCGAGTAVGMGVVGTRYILEVRLFLFQAVRILRL